MPLRDVFAAALKQFLAAKQPKLVLMPHTYQVRDFRPQACYRHGADGDQRLHRFPVSNAKLVFTRQMFQGKLAADVEFHLRCSVVRDIPEWSVLRGDKAEAGASATPVETVNVEIAEGVIRDQPRKFSKKRSRRSIFYSGRDYCAVGRGIKEQKNIEIAKQLAEALGGENLAASRADLRFGWLPMDRQIGSWDKRSRLSFTWRSASAARSSTLSE